MYRSEQIQPSLSFSASADANNAAQEFLRLPIGLPSGLANTSLTLPGPVFLLSWFQRLNGLVRQWLPQELT